MPEEAPTTGAFAHAGVGVGSHGALLNPAGKWAFISAFRASKDESGSKTYVYLQSCGHPSEHAGWERALGLFTLLLPSRLPVSLGKWVL